MILLFQNTVELNSHDFNFKYLQKKPLIPPSL